MNRGFPIPLPVEGLMARAREIAGVDIYDEDIIEPLTVMVKSLNEDSELHEAGAVAMQDKLLRLLANRLRMQRDYAAHPEIHDQVIKAPIVICGMGRTGSTMTQKLLSASGDFNWLPFWQVFNPSLFTGSRDESPEPRIKECEVFCDWFDRVSPDTKYGHAMEAHEPDEESYILDHTLRFPGVFGFAEMPGFLRWLANQDIGLQFDYLLDALKYLQWQGLQDPNKRWVLKCPLYFGIEPELVKRFPDATFVMTHRHPLETIPSSCRLLETFHQPYAAPVIDCNALMHNLAGQMNQHIQTRETRKDIHFLDLNYHELAKSKRAGIEKIYRHAGEVLSERSWENIENWIKNNPKNKKGVHQYSLEDFDLTREMIEEAFSSYIALLETLFGD